MGAHSIRQLRKNTSIPFVEKYIIARAMHVYFFRKKKSAAKEAEAETDAQPMLPEVSKERFFEVSESIKDAFKKNEESEPKGFSLLAAFGRKDSDSEEEIGNISEDELNISTYAKVHDPQKRLDVILLSNFTKIFPMV